VTTPSISRYLNVRQAYWPSFSSDGEQIAFLTDITGVPQVWRVLACPGASGPLWPEQLTYADRAMGAWCSPTPGDPRLIYACDMGGNERAQLYLLPGDGSPERCLTEGHEDAMHIYGAWSADGTCVLYAANRRDPALFDLYAQPLEGEGRLVWCNDAPGFLYGQSFSPDGQRAVVTRTSSSFDHALLEVDLARSTARRLLASDERVRFVAVCYAPGGDALYLITDLDSDFLYLARLDLDTGDLTRLAAPEWDCECLALSPDGRALAYAVNVEGAHQIHLLDLASGETRSAPPIADAPGLIPDGRLTCAPEGARIAFAWTSATRTADIWVWDLASNRVQAVTRSSHGGLSPASFAVPELIRYPTFDRDERGQVRQIPAWLYRPTAMPDQRLPVVVLAHGGPEGQSRPAFHFFVQYLMQSGYAVLVPNVRGSTGYGKAYSHLDDVRKRMDSVADLAHAARWLAAQPEFDPGRIAVYGGSYGGFMVLAALTAYPDLWAAGVDIVGISNLATFLENTSDYRRGHREAEYGSLAEDRTFLAEIAPINHVDQIAAPLIVIHGANDPRVPLSEAEQLVAALKERDIEVEFLVFPDEGHGIVKLANKQVAYPAIVAFLERHMSRQGET